MPRAFDLFDKSIVVVLLAMLRIYKEKDTSVAQASLPAPLGRHGGLPHHRLLFEG